MEHNKVAVMKHLLEKAMDISKGCFYALDGKKILRRKVNGMVW